MNRRFVTYRLCGMLVLLATLHGVGSSMAGERASDARARANCLADAAIWVELRRSACESLLATPAALEDRERARAHRNRGDARLTLGDLDGAAEDYTRTIEFDPRDVEALHHRCWVRALLGRQLADALADCNEAVSLRPASARILSARAFALLKMERYQEAIADYDVALKAEPDDADNLYARGVAKQRAGNEDGVADMKAALAADPAVAFNLETLERFSEKPIGHRLIEVWRSILKAIF